MKKKGRKVQDDLNDIDYYEKLDDEGKKFMRKFQKDWVRGPSYKNGEVSIKDPEFFKEAVRNNNMRNRDAFSVAKKSGTLDYQDDDYKQFMEDASDAWEWQNVYKMHGYEEAIKCIFNQTINEINNSTIDLNVVLSRFYIKVTEVRRLNAKEISTKGKK